MYKKICKRAAIYEIREGFISGVGFGLSMCSAYLIFAATFYVGARLVEDGKTTFPHVLRVRRYVCSVSHAFTFSLMVL